MKNIIITILLALSFSVFGNERDKVYAPLLQTLKKEEWEKKYNNHPDKKKFWEVFQPIGSDLLTNKYRKPMTELAKEWEEVEKNLPNKKDVFTPPSSGK